MAFIMTIYDRNSNNNKLPHASCRDCTTSYQFLLRINTTCIQVLLDGLMDWCTMWTLDFFHACFSSSGEGQKQCRRTEVWVMQRKARTVGKWHRVLYLYQPVCQSSTLLQRIEGEEQEDENKWCSEWVKNSGKAGRIDHKKTHEEIQGKERNRITSRGTDHLNQKSTKLLVWKKTEAAVRSLRKMCFTEEQKNKNCSVWGKKPCSPERPIAGIHNHRHAHISTNSSGEENQREKWAHVFNSNVSCHCSI